MSESPTSADLLITNGRVVTMNAHRDVLINGALAIVGESIAAVGGTEELRSRFPGIAELDARGGIVLPGIVNAHQHATGAPLLWSCIPDNLAQGVSIYEWSVPMHAVETPEDDELSAKLIAAQSLRNGVTTLIEPGTIAAARPVAKGLAAAGIRGTVGVWAWNMIDGPFVAPEEEILERLEDVLVAFPKGGLIEGWVTLIGHSMASDKLLTGSAELARSYDTNMTMHLSPHSGDAKVYLERNGVRPAVHLNNLGVLGEHMLLGHAVWLDDDEIDVILESRTAIAYCPWAYLRLAQGVTGAGRHAEIYKRGGRVALGCDSVNAGDSVDVLRTAALVAGLAKDVAIDGTWFGAHEALEMATIAGAEAIGMDDRIGSLEVGKLADVVVFESESPQWACPGDPALQLVWGTDGRSVRHVFVNGEHVVDNGTCTKVDEVALRAEAVEMSASIVKRAGLTIPTRWPVQTFA